MNIISCLIIGKKQYIMSTPNTFNIQEIILISKVILPFVRNQDDFPGTYGAVFAMDSEIWESQSVYDMV